MILLNALLHITPAVLTWIQRYRIRHINGDTGMTGLIVLAFVVAGVLILNWYLKVVDRK